MSESRCTRIVDAAAAAVLLGMLALPMLGICITIRLTSPGPALFRQVRLGRDLAPFTLFKFRTMYVDARERFPNLYDYDSILSQPDFQFKQASDPRVTAIGRVLRRTGLDELPNLINIVRGEMGLVGPRPDIPEMLPRYSERQRERFRVRPGLTSLAHIRGGNRLTFDQTADFDIEYAETRTRFLDLTILINTFAAIARGDLH
jgi:lipopolysaccharide/colanic/teichoic acid biosynthesis glycosyltransferase